jgi:flagellar M-ring protein FliF
MNCPAGRGRTSLPRHDQNRKSEEIVNYEISRTTKTEVIESGRVNRISVAVLVDGVYSKNDKGEAVYQPRDKEEIDLISSLVRTAIGFDQKRGDQVEVVNLRFAEAPVNAIAEPTGWTSMLQFTKEDILRGVELLIMALLGIVVVLLVVRPLVRRMLSSEHPVSHSNTALLAAAVAGGAGTGGPLPDDVQAAIASVNTDDLKAVPSHTAKMIDIAQVQGQVHALSVQKVGELADKNPNETVSIIRQWLHDSAA